MAMIRYAALRRPTGSPGQTCLTALTARLGLLVVLAISSSAQSAQGADPERLRVMTYNLWIGGESGGQPLEQSAAVIKAAAADVVGLQETLGEERDGARPDNGAKIAKLLGYEYLDQGDGTAVMTRHRIVGHSPRRWGVEVELPSGRRVWLFNAHFAASPYQPYQLLGIPYNDAPFLKTAGEAVDAAHDARGDQAKRMLAEVRDVQRSGAPIFITGDFNEPSTLDWTEASAQAGRCPLCIQWPATKSVLAAGFVDAYRATHVDPVASPGHTWTTLTAEDDPADRHDRIDFVFFSGPADDIRGAEVVGEKRERADIVIAPYPSDHRSVVAEVELR